MAIINGTNNADTLVGTNVDDIISGLNGNDIIRGGDGADTISGGAGNDTFLYLAVTESTLASPDIVTDFTRGFDRIDLSSLLGAIDLIWGGTSAIANGIWYIRNGTTVSLFIDTNAAPATADFSLHRTAP